MENSIKIYAAPMEGLTRYCFRNAHNRYFGGIDKYFAPFIPAKSLDTLKSRDLNDILPKNNKDLVLIPQIMTNKSEAFLTSAKMLSELGYSEVNLNLGCPSKTVVTKGLAAGFLKDPDALEAFLDEVFSKVSVDVSIKTRIGVESPEEFERLLEIYNRFPIKELIIHPRTANQMYTGKPDYELFSRALMESKALVCCNGDLISNTGVSDLLDKNKGLSAIMLGRGLIAHPALPAYIKENSIPDRRTYLSFHNELLASYHSIYSGDKDVLFKMKEFWIYFGKNFCGAEKPLKKIKKAGKLAEYKEIANEIINNCEIWCPENA